MRLRLVSVLAMTHEGGLSRLTSLIRAVITGIGVIVVKEKDPEIWLLGEYTAIIVVASNGYIKLLSRLRIDFVMLYGHTV